MRKRMLFGILLALLASLVFAGSAFAAVSQTTIDKILADAQDGYLDGTYTSAEIAAALHQVESDPLGGQYSNLEAVLASYSSGGNAPSTASSSGSLAFTGINVVLALGAGAGLIGGGLALRRRRT